MTTNKTRNSLENSHGGARPGAGRPKLDNPRKAHSFSCTNTEAEIIRKVLFFLRTYPELIYSINNKSFSHKVSGKNTTENNSVQDFQWLESEAETNLAVTSRKISAAPLSKNLQWLESEAEQESIVPNVKPKIRKSVLEIAKGLSNIIADKF